MKRRYKFRIIRKAFNKVLRKLKAQRRDSGYKPDPINQFAQEIAISELKEMAKNIKQKRKAGRERKKAQKNSNPRIDRYAKSLLDTFHRYYPEVMASRLPFDAIRPIPNSEMPNLSFLSFKTQGTKTFRHSTNKPNA